MRDYYYEIGRRIASLRQERHITQEQLAEILDISIKHCSEVERGLSSLSLEKLIFVSDYFDCNMDYLIHGISEKDICLAFPKEMIQIMRSGDEEEKKLLTEYLRMYGKLRHSQNC
ncbi:MAG: helix-turn-helix transcriptional regulator [Lachnospiraceae bacterium]|nr:helix-turn-helix transcriptional regulator [Lachnospiraceae bacterium]